MVMGMLMGMDKWEYGLDNGFGLIDNGIIG